MKIILPKSKEDLRISHLNMFTDEMSDVAVPGLEHKIKILNRFTGISKPRLYTVDIPGIDEAFNHLMKIIASVNIEAPILDEVTLNGQTFVRIDPEKAPSGWHADYHKSDFQKDPVRLACMCYIPKGSFYGQLDQHDNLVYPLHSRHELFEKEFPLEAYISMNAFFLPKFAQLVNDYMVRQKKAKRKERLEHLISGLGKSFSTLWQKNIT